MRKHNERFRGRDEITVYGRRAVLEALAIDSVEVLRLAVARETPGAFREELALGAEARGVAPELSNLREVGRLSADPRNDQGVVARIRLGLVHDLAEFLVSRDAHAPTRLLALDGVTNPQNVGMIVRSAVASGMDGMLWPLAGSPWVSGLIIKASAASVYRCPIVRTPSLAEGLITLQKSGYRSYGLVMDGARPLFEVRPAARSVFVIGRETEGISREVLALLDEKVSIPMQGGIESLNAAVAASLVCFQVMGS